MTRLFRERVRTVCHAGRVREANRSRRYTTFQVGGPADFWSTLPPSMSCGCLPPRAIRGCR
jgi:hypothetical protein